MKEIQGIFAEAERFKERRSYLSKQIRNVDEKHKRDLDKLDKDYAFNVKALEAERKFNLDSIAKNSGDAIASYTRMKNDLQEYVAPVRQWCPDASMADYVPNPARIDEAAAYQLLRMLQEQGVIAWVKRTFKLDGYSSRSEMALDLCRKIEDACALCSEKIIEIENNAEKERSSQVTLSRRKIEEEQLRFQSSRRQLEIRQKDEKERALMALADFDASRELAEMHSRIAAMNKEAKASCGAWGEYTVPEVMPDRVLLCDVKLSLPNTHGIEEMLPLPLWIDLYESNIIVITSASGLVSDADCAEKLFVRKLLARMIKTIPPERCSYSVFDSLTKGASLERLIDITNIGTTDFNFELFTSNESSDKIASCAERRKYLRDRPAEIIQFMAGRCKSLYEYTRKYGRYEFPFSWFIDFNFPYEPDSRMLEDIKELFVNAQAAGYSFVFVTTPGGYEKLKELASKYTQTQVLHIDMDREVCEKSGFEVSCFNTGEPSSEQIFNFVTALKKYYEDGKLIDNRIDSVLFSKGIELHDASKELRIPMALDSRGRLIDLILGGDESVHGFISGGTNSGKSTLLHTIILSACLHYHPSDLEIWLVDYKQTEFFLYKNDTPPHVKLIGVSKTADFTFSLLDKIEIEANRRTELFNRFGARDLKEYRKHASEPGYVNIPRLFIIIDEFHEMSQFVATDVVFRDKLENTVREYRAQGVTCLFADQTFSTGLSGLTPAAKNQIGLRIAMRNEASPQELKNTLEVDRALYSDNMQHTISIMSQGEFIMKVYIRDYTGKLTDIRLEKFKGLHTMGDDIAPISSALRAFYKGHYTKELLYINTNEKVTWSDSEPAALDRQEPLRYPNVRLYLGRSATLRPCFGLDIGRQPNENLAIVGGTAFQRWEIVAAVLRSCKYRKYKLLAFMAEYSDLMSDFGQDIRKLCTGVPDFELMETTEEWCRKLSDLERIIDDRQSNQDIICLFIGLEIANIEFGRLPDRAGIGGNNAFTARLSKYAMRVESETSDAAATAPKEPEAFNALPIIDKLFSSGARSGIRCITEVSVYRQFSGILRIKDMCRHKIAFSMSADDCLMYLGNSSFQKSIGQNALYCDGGKEAKKLLPYKLK